MKTGPTIRASATIGLAIACLLALPIRAEPPQAAAPDQVFKRETPIGTLNVGVASGTLRVSANGQRIAYMATLEDGGEAVFVNDKQSPKYGGIVNDSLSFSPDSLHVAWAALRDGKKVVVVDDKEYSAFNGSAEGMPVWSPDSQRFAYFAATNDGQVLAVVDGVPGEPWDSVIRESFVFSPESTRFAYVAKDGDGGRVIVDGKPGTRYRNVAGFTFSPDGKHFAYIAMFTESMSVIVDGVEMARGRIFIKDTLRFDGPRSLHVIRLDGDKLVREQIDLIATSSKTKGSSQK